ncbi:MAG: glycosyltransferase family 4 protein [Candidatus Omnitrophota bacterium]
MRKVNILYVITKLELGGAQKQLWNLIRHLSKERFNIFLFTARDGLLMDDFFSLEGLTLRKSINLERRINPFKDLLSCIEIYRYIKENDIDIVHTHSSKAGIVGRLAARVAGAKWIIHTVHGWSFNDFQSVLRRVFFLWLERWIARFTDRLVVVSEYDRLKGLRHRIGKCEQYRRISYGIHLSDFLSKDNEARSRLGLKDADLAVGMVACFKPQKSPQDFIRLASVMTKKLTRLKFVLVGDGQLRRSVEKLIRKCDLNEDVILTGWRKDVREILAALDVLVLTSLWEGLPICVLEAMAAKKPVVATDTGGIAEIVREGQTGYLVKPHDIDQMAERLRFLLEDERLRRDMGASAQQSLGEDFTVSNMSKNTESLYEELIGASQRKEQEDVQRRH